MLHGGEVKIIDFGYAERIEQGQYLSEAAGTPSYLAPELFQQKYTNKCDLWSIGVITYEMIAGYRPFRDKKKTKLYAKIQKGEYPLCGDPWNDISEEAKDLISKLLELDQDKRLSAEQALRHPWLRQTEIELVQIFDHSQCG